MGSNCKDDPVMIHFTKHLVKQMETIEAKQYMVRNVQVKFVCQLVPCDQKWLACMAGELNSAATLGGGGGGGSIGDKNATWQCWKFADRIKKAKAVEKYKQKLSQTKLKARAKVTNLWEIEK